WPPPPPTVLSFSIYPRPILASSWLRLRAGQVHSPLAPWRERTPAGRLLVTHPPPLGGRKRQRCAAQLQCHVGSQQRRRGRCAGMRGPAFALAAFAALSPGAPAAARDPGGRYVVPLHRHRTPVRSDGTGLVSFKNTYFGRVTVGADEPQAFDVVFDTGSGQLVVPDSRCGSTPCLTHRRYDREASRHAVDDVDHDGTPVPMGEPRDQITIAYGTGEEQGETLLLHLTREAATATRHLRPGSVQFAGGLQTVIMALDTLAFPEADAETFQQLEKTLFAAPRARDETLMKFTNRIHSEQKELVRLLPNALNETVMGFLLLRGAGMAKTERNQVPSQTGYDYGVNKLVAILKRMTDDHTVTEKTSTTRTAAYLAGVTEEEPQEATEGEDEDNPIYDAMANLLGIDDDKEPDDKLENGEALTGAEALDCLAALVGPPPKPRTWGEARKIVADKKTNRGFHNIKDRKRTEEKIEDIKKRTKCGICKKLVHWHKECPDNPKNKVRATGGFFAMTVLQDDEVCSYVATEAKMAARSNMVEHVTLAIDIEKSGRPGWGAVDTACGFNMMGLATFDAWAKHYKDVHSITLETVPYHKKYRFGNDQVCTATEGVFIPIMLGHFSGVIFVCLVKGAAPLLLSKTFVVELKASLHAFQSELDLPEQNVRLPLARAGGEHFLVQLDNFARPWKKPESWTLCSREVSMDFGTSSEHIHLSSTSGPKDFDRPQKIGSCYFSGALGTTEDRVQEHGNELDESNGKHNSVREESNYDKPSKESNKCNDIVAEAGATEAAARLVNPQKDPKVRDNPERGKVFQWPWHEIDNQPRPPTGAMICRFLDIPNQGPCPPRGNPRQARDHDPARETACVHEFTGHGGNGRAFWVQCCGCKMHLEYYPQSAPGMMKVINVLNDFKDEEARIKGWKPRTTKTSSKKKEETETRPTATSGTASTSPRTTSRTNQKHQDNRCQKDELEEETEDWEQLGESPRSKALTALRELLQRLLEKLSDKQNSMINKSIQQISDFEDLAQAVEAAIPESSAFMNQEGDRAERSLTNKEIVALMGSHLLTRMGQREVWSKLQHSAHLVVVTKPPKDIYNTKLKEKIGKEMLTFISDVAIKQAANGRHFYYEQDMNSRDWEDPPIKKLKRLPDIGEDGALRKGRKYFSNLPNEATEHAKLLSQEFVNRPPHTALGDIDDSLQELVGALVRTIIKMKTTKELGKQIEEQSDHNNGSQAPMPSQHTEVKCTACCAAPTTPTTAPKDEKSTDPHVKQQVHKIHENMGHCSNENLVMVLKYGKARQAFIEAAQKLECPSCEANKRPKLAKPPKAPTTYQFSDVIGMGIFFVLGPESTTKVPMLNLVCHGTGHQVAIPLPSRHGLQIRRHYRAFWKRVYWVPRMIVTDGEKGFSAGELPEAAEGDGSEIKVTSATSPWQAGKTERAGGTWKETFYRTRQKFNTNNWEDFYELVDAVNVAMGESVRRGGFTPYQRIFGRPFRLPEKILEEGPPSLSTVSRAMNGDTELARSIDMRKAAMAAYIEAECSEKWRRALQRRTRPTRGTTFQPGDRCYVWRSSTDKLPTSSWHGPARVIKVELPSTVWCSYQGGLLKCSPEQLRHANEAEVAAWGQIDNTTKEELNTENRGRRKCEGLTRQDQPPDDLEVPHVVPPEPAADDQGAASQPPITEIEKGADVNPELIPMATKYCDHLDDVPFTINERIVVIEEKINKEAEAPPKKKVKKVKASVVSSAMLTNTNQRLREEITEKSLLNTYKYQPYIAAKRREWGNIKNAQAIRLLSLAETDTVRQDPDRASRIMGSRWVLTDKGGNPDEVDASKRQLMFMGDGTWRMAKARWTVQGHTDPDLLDLETYSPVVGKDSVFLILQILCSNKWTLQLADITSAFTAGDPLGRSRGSLYVELPRTGIPDVEDSSLVELLKAVYGLGDAPLHWLSAFTKYARVIGFQCFIFDSCVFYLRDEKGLHGAMGLTVDDIVGGGDVLFDTACQKLRESGKYTGKELQQNEDNTEITISQSFSLSSIQLINIATERRKEPHSAANRIGRLTEEFSSVVLKIKHIPFHEMAFAVFNDAAWANARDGASQAGYIVFATQRKLLKGEPAIISIQSWKSHKLKRKCAHQEWRKGELIRTMLLEIMDSEFDLMRPYMPASKFPVISVTDSRGGYDHVTNPKAGLAEDKRAAIDVAIVRATMQRPEVHLRWIEGTSQLTDPLTKRMGESALLRQALHDGEYGITADSIFDARKKEPANFAVTNCCFSGLHLYEMDCTGTLGATSNVDDLNYEPEAYKRLRETQQIFRERPEASRLNQAGMRSRSCAGSEQ
ncbi:unnamed protein product, partial [Prorocentrum cordatum]